MHANSNQQHTGHAQGHVARRLEAVAVVWAPQFIISTGDQIYPSGVVSGKPQALTHNATPPTYTDTVIKTHANDMHNVVHPTPAQSHNPSLVSTPCAFCSFRMSLRSLAQTFYPLPKIR